MSAAPFPDAIPPDRFYLTEDRKFQVAEGEWFGLSGVVLYARRSPEHTAEVSRLVRFHRADQQGKLEVVLPDVGSRPPRTVELKKTGSRD